MYGGRVACVAMRKENYRHPCMYQHKNHARQDATREWGTRSWQNRAQYIFACRHMFWRTI